MFSRYQYPLFYLDFLQKAIYYSSDDNHIELLRMENDTYIIHSNTHKLHCPFCNKQKMSIYSFSCPRCGSTMTEMCARLYEDWNIDGHRYTVTSNYLDSYPEKHRQRYLEKAIRAFITKSMPYSVQHYFQEIIEDVQINTLIMLYQKSIGIDTVEQNIKDEIERNKKPHFNKVLRRALKVNSESTINVVWKYFQEYIKYISRSGQTSPEVFARTHIDESLSKSENIQYFVRACSYLNEQVGKYASVAYRYDQIVDYYAGRKRLICMSLLGKPIGIKDIKDLVMTKIYGDLELGKKNIYRTVEITKRDTIEETDYLRQYHKECDHYCEKVYLQIPLLLASGDLIIRTLQGMYCDKCKKYFVLDTEFRKILLEGKIQAQISFRSGTGHFNGMELSAESLLRKCGYSVSATYDFTNEQRQKLLKAIVENELYTPSGIVSHFRFLISMNANVTSRDMSNAISKWKEDIAYLEKKYN